MSYQELMKSDPTIDRTALELGIKETTDQPNSQTTTILTPPSTSMMSYQEQTALSPLASLIEEHTPSLSSSEKSPPYTGMMNFQELTTSDQSSDKSHSDQEINETTSQQLSLVE